VIIAIAIQGRQSDSEPSLVWSALTEKNRNTCSYMV
jgi:hypothetical protein